MKKIYSIVLMAAALLVGTNAWGAAVCKIGSTGYDTFKEALQNAQSGDEILLVDNATMNDSYDLIDGRAITVNLNGKDITGSSLRINIYHGTLSFTGAGTVKSHDNAVVRLLGCTNSEAVNWSVLNVGENVNLLNEDEYYCVFVASFDNTNANYSTLGYYTKNYRTVGGVSKTAAYGVVINVDGYVSGYYAGLYVNGAINETTGNIPVINISSTGTVIGTCPEGAGIYAAGYAEWNIHGIVTGDNGIYCKGGEVNLDGATITAVGAYKQPNPNGDGFDASGSALVFDSYKGYSDNLSLNVTGNTVVTSEHGYAIEEVVTNGKEKMDAEDFVIESGTFTGAVSEGKSAVTITTDLSTEVKQEGTVSGGMFNSDVSQVLADGAIKGDVIEVEIGGNTYKVIYEKAEDGMTLANSDLTKSVVMDGTTYTVAANQTAKAKALNLKNGATVIVEGTLVIGTDGSVIDGATSKLTVKAGGRLIVNAGILTTSADQLVIEASETNSGILVAAPGVTWNAQPLATVQFYTFAKQLSATNNVWQRIATPLSVFGSISNDFASPKTTQDGKSFGSWVNKWNQNTQKWEAISAWTELTPFVGYALTNNSNEGGVTYSFKGNLQGGVSSALAFQKEGFNLFGNSYTAPIQLDAMLPIMVAAGADNAAHLWNAQLQRFDQYSTWLIASGLVSADPIPAAQTFILKWNNNEAKDVDLDYAASVWAPYASLASTSAAPAPARRTIAQNNFNAVKINITAADGDVDNVILVEGAQFSEAFDNGADIVKYMEPNRLNFYVEGAEKYSSSANDILLGTTLAIQTQNEINYTMTFSKVMGEQYAIKDVVTGVVTNMVEGAEYNFVAQANATTEGRFQIVERNNAPAAVETVEAINSNVKGIYTILGQYVGEKGMWNTLPAGVYVVDGVKLVK